MSSLKHYFDFLFAMTEKEIKARYKKTTFGLLWMLFNPIFQMIVIGLIFSLFIKIPIENYFIYLFSGLLPWQFVSTSLVNSTESFVSNRTLLQKSKFSYEVIPLSIILANYYHFVLAFIIFILFMTLMGLISYPNILFLIPAFIMLLLFVVGASLLTSSLQVKFRDIKYFVQAALMLWFYATPIVYPLDFIPVQFKSIFTLNPVTIIFELIHKAINIKSDLSGIYIIPNLLIVIFIFILGVYFFKKESKYFVDLL